MNEKTKDADPVSEDVAKEPDVKAPEGEEKAARQVPLEALEAERRKRQEAETQAKLYENLMRQAEESKKQKVKEEPSEDDDELVNRRDLKQFHQKLTKEEMMALKREIAEETFKETKPEAIKAINTHLKEILERKPWLADSIAGASNRYARAYEIVNDYMPQVTSSTEKATEAKKIVENAQKPGSPIGVGKSQQLSGADYMKSIAGTNEFRDYRKQLLGR
jgi:hypothetical protein